MITASYLAKSTLLFLVLIMFLSIVSTSHAIECSLSIKESEIRQKWTGDYDEMVEERIIRALVPVSKTFYFLDGVTQRGLTYEGLKEFEKYVNRQEKTKDINIRVIIIPTPRNRLFSDLNEGVGDIAAENLIISANRDKLFDFSDPFIFGVDEIVVTGTSEPALKSLFDLSGRKVFVRTSSSYHESLLKFNQALKEIGKVPIEIVAADEHLEDEDLLEMMNAGVIPISIIDSYKGKLWAKIFKNIVVYPDIKVNTGGEFAWVFRKNSLKLKEVVNAFVKENKQGTLMGNILINRYLNDTKHLKNNLSKREIAKFEKVIDLFKKYGNRYDFDWLMLAALSYQESQLDHSRRSKSGAIGIMQILPSTASDPNVGIKNIEQLENNIHAGTKYLRFMVNRYCVVSMDNLNKGLFAFASYNAGPAKVQKLRKEAENKGLDPNVWFNNVEIVAARRIGQETVQYVRNIYKYYIAYKIITKNMNLKQVRKALLEEYYR